MQEKNELPNLWIEEWRGDILSGHHAWDCEEKPPVACALYIPAERIEKLVKKWSDRERTVAGDCCASQLAECAHELELLISPEK